MQGEGQSKYSRWFWANATEEQKQRRREEEAAQEAQALPPIPAPFQKLTVENPLNSRALLVPRYVRVHGGRIEWSLGNPNLPRDDWQWGLRADGTSPFQPEEVTKPERAALPAFIELADEQDEQRFAQFAKDYGVLGLCRVGKGKEGQKQGVSFDNHGSREDWYPGVRDNSRPPRLAWNEGDTMRWYWEPIEGWRAYARQARAALRIAKSLRDGDPVRGDEWLAFPNAAEDRTLQHLAEHGSLPTQRNIFSGIIFQRWLANAGITLQLAWENERNPQLYLGSGGFYNPGGWPSPDLTAPHDSLDNGWPMYPLFGILALQLVGALSADERIIPCSRCGKVFLFEGERMPRHDQPHYCSTVCAQEANRENKREWAAKTRAAKKAAARQADNPT